MWELGLLRRDGPAAVAKVWGSVVMGAGAMPRMNMARASAPTKSSTITTRRSLWRTRLLRYRTDFTEPISIYTSSNN
jgi:hypothetical protein